LNSPKQKPLTVRTFGSFSELSPHYAAVSTRGNPTLSATWLSALESTGCVSEERGWVPNHIGVFEDETLVAAMPAYIKFNSEGEFIFDHAIARAAPQFGVRYFPKLLIAVPFTPATGPRVLHAEGTPPERAELAAAAAINALLQQLPVSSVHMLFAEKEVAERMQNGWLLHRHSLQFHWRNRNFESFESFLATLPSKRRTNIRRERRALTEQQIRIENIRGQALEPRHADLAYELYLTTVDKFMWGRRYLNRAFFEEVMRTMPEAIDLVLAFERDANTPIAGAFNLRGASTLYGRYWGTHKEVPFLHFNVCFYHSIARCIEEGVQTFEPGAGGEHKLARGFEPTITHSLHAFREPRLGAVVDDYFTRERALLASEIGGEAADG
jgi:uncharacterized protein